MLTLARQVVGHARNYYFDFKHNVSTAGEVELHGLRLQGNREAGKKYTASHPKLLHELLDRDIDHARYSFIDLGSGKGRSLFVAAEYPFRQIIGVEFAHELHKIAVSNLQRYRGEGRTKNIQLIWGDAAEFKFPDTPLFVFMANPFAEPVMRPVCQNLQRSLEIHPRHCLLTYVAPFYADVIRAETNLAQIEESEYHVTFH